MGFAWPRTPVHLPGLRCRNGDPTWGRGLGLGADFQLTRCPLSDQLRTVAARAQMRPFDSAIDALLPVCTRKVDVRGLP